jgi:hypothetical protein
MITLTEAKYVDGYRIWIKFSDGMSGVVDFTDIIRKFPAARPLADQTEFQRFHLDNWPTLVWPCGFDFSPEGLYELATGRSVAWLHDDVTETTHV